MEKRHIPFPPNNSKKMRLDMPQGGGAGPSTSNKDPFDDNTWDNEEIDEMILMASQTCEIMEEQNFLKSTNIFGSNMALDKSIISLTNGNVNSVKNNEPLREIADYVLRFKPPLTSTQKTVVCESGTFKTPPRVTTTCVMSGKVTTMTTSAGTRIVDGSAYTFHELQASKVKLDRLEYEYAQLQDNFVSKEGEVTLLRSKLKSAQSQISHEKINKLKMEEQLMAQADKKVKGVEREMNDIKTKMEFQDLEISKLKEKCQMLEKGSKLKFTQPNLISTPKPKWPSFSQKMDASILNESHIKKVPPDNVKKRDICQPIRLGVDIRKEFPLQSSIPGCIFHHQYKKDIPIEYKCNREPSTVEHSSFMDIRRRIMEEFRSSRPTDSVKDDNSVSARHNDSNKKMQNGTQGSRIKFEAMFEDLAMLSRMSEVELKTSEALDAALRICLMGKVSLNEVLRQLQNLSRKVNPQTIKEMDEVYLAYMTNNPDTMTTRNLFDESLWCDNEQAVDARRILAVIAKLCLWVTTITEHVCGLLSISSPGDLDVQMSDENVAVREDYDDLNSCLLDLSLEVYKKIEYTGCSQRYPGLLSSLSMLVEHCISSTTTNMLHPKVFDFCKCLLLLRPNGRCVVEVLKIFERLSCDKCFLHILCKNADSGSNMIIDYSQGVTLCSSESCVIQLLCTQVEVWSLHLTKNQDTGPPLLEMTRCLLNVYDAGTQHDLPWTQHKQDNKCSCSVRIFQCLVVCLHHTAKFYINCKQLLSDELHSSLIHVLSNGLIVLKSNISKDPDVVWRLKDYEGHYQMFIQIMSQIDGAELHSWHKYALTELSSNLVSDVQKPDTPTQTLWEDVIDRFIISD